MLNRFLYVTLILLISRCVAAQQKSFKDTVALYFDEIKTVTAEYKNVWDYDLYAPILLVDQETRQIYGNIPDTAGVLKRDGTIFTGILPRSVNIANTAASWSGIDWAMFRLPLPEEKNDRLDLLAHELFHRAQPHLGFKLYNVDNNHLDQKEGRIYLRLELEALKAALLAGSQDERMRSLSSALVFRKYRYSIYPKADSTENLLELNEGLAEYTGMIMSGRNQQHMQDHVVERMNNFFLNPTFVRSFAYQTIPVYGALLQSYNKEWIKQISIGTNLTAYFIQSFHIQLPGDLKSAVSQLAVRYHGQNIIAEETGRQVKINKLIAEYKKAFIEQPHLDIPLRHMNVSFDPRNIMPLEDRGTIYPNLRITDEWGILTVTKGALMSPSWNNVAVTLPIRIGKEEVLGDGWKLELYPGFDLQKEETSSNYILRKR